MTTDALLARIPVCEASKETKTSLIDSNFDITGHVDAMYADDIAHLQRICKEACLAEELAKIEEKKRTFETLYYDHLQGFVATLEDEEINHFSHILPMRWESRCTVPGAMIGTDKDERMVARALALRVFTSDLRRKKYMVHVSYSAKNDGPHLHLGETIEIRR